MRRGEETEQEAPAQLVFWAYYFEPERFDRAWAYDRLLDAYPESTLSFWEHELDQLDALRQRRGRGSAIIDDAWPGRIEPEWRLPAPQDQP